MGFGLLVGQNEQLDGITLVFCNGQFSDISLIKLIIKKIIRRLIGGCGTTYLHTGMNTNIRKNKDTAALVTIQNLNII